MSSDVQFREIPKLDGGTCATCTWGKPDGRGSCSRPVTSMSDFLKECESKVRGETFAYSLFWGDWCRHWSPNSNYAPPIEGLPRFPAFTTSKGTYVFCPGCGEFLMLGGKKTGQISSHHNDRHCGNMTYFADVMGPMTPGAKQLKKVGERWKKQKSFIDLAGPKTTEFRFEDMAFAEKMVHDVFVRTCSMSECIARELLRYLRMGSNYPFKCNFSKQIQEGWIIGEQGEIISPVPKK